MPKLGFMERKVTAPQNPEQLIGLLAEIMAASVNNEVDIDNAKLALNAATRIVEVWQADTRMKALAIASQRTISNAQGWALVDVNPKIVEGSTDA